MAERVVVHIGLMKSGTTFLQGRLDANREQLAAQGVLFPGPTGAATPTPPPTSPTPRIVSRARGSRCARRPTTIRAPPSSR